MIVVGEVILVGVVMVVLEVVLVLQWGLTSEGSVERGQKGPLSICSHVSRQTQLGHHVREDGLGFPHQLHHLLS